ncbi:transposable element tc3 transposase [Plakobranchus ocellatus]|uniref:Transposable element tc3 transposase n=1 Tax=Plakobranchus ocellatus TaxID=259542 RepID=A0AAV4ALT1_9GAST|nr:transposable element tc3 transposase [Plakobranchus ocellatus]
MWRFSCVRNYLNPTFPGRRIGRRGPVEWPPRSPDLSPLDYFPWRHLKLKAVVYQNLPRTPDDLKDAIVTECQKIITEILKE